MSDQWGTSPQGEDEARKRQAEREKDFERKLDQALERHLGIVHGENKGVRLDKDPITRALYTSHQPHDTAARREAIALHMETIGIRQELIQVRQILELGSGAPPGRDDRRDPNSKGAPMRERNTPGQELGKNPPTLGDNTGPGGNGN